MKIEFCLEWISSRSVNPRNFKLKAYHSLFLEYIERINHFSSCEVFGALPLDVLQKPGTKTWVCEAGSQAQSLTSEELAKLLGRLVNTGIQRLRIVIGGAEGIPSRRLETLKPDFKWSFGPLTLPHELACVVASEQIYRAWTILKGLPYHLSH